MKQEPSRSIRVVQIAGSEETFCFLSRFSAALVAEGFSVAHAARQAGNVDHAGVEFIPLPLTRRLNLIGILKAIIHTAQFLRRHKVDILIANTFSGGVIGRLAGCLARVPVVYYWPHGWLFTSRTPKSKRRLIIWTERFLARFHHAVVCISEEETETGFQNGILQDPKRTIQLLGIGIDTRRYSLAGCEPASRLRLCAELNLESQSFVFIFVGRLVEEKGIFELVEAFEEVHRQYQHARLVIVGDVGSDEPDQASISQFTAQIGSSSASTAIRQIGRRSDIPLLLSCAQAFVFPSWREGMPVSLLEAMSMELPAVATDIPGCREEVLDGETGLIVPRCDPAALAQAMGILISDPISARRMGKAGRRRVERYFRLETVVPVFVDSLMIVREQLLACEPVICFKRRELDLSSYNWPRDRIGS